MQLHGQNSNLILVAAVADGPTPGLPSVPGSLKLSSLGHDEIH